MEREVGAKKKRTHKIAEVRDEGFRVGEGKPAAVARAKHSWWETGSHRSALGCNGDDVDEVMTDPTETTAKSGRNREVPAAGCRGLIEDLSADGKVQSASRDAPDVQS